MMPYGPGNNGSAFVNGFINGDAFVNQILNAGGSATVNIGATNITRWSNVDMIGTISKGSVPASAHTIRDSQQSDHPILGTQGFCKSIICDIPGTVSADSAGVVCNTIEGFNFEPFFGLQVAASFWVKSPKTGLHSVAFGNDVDRSFIRNYIVVAANTWQQIFTGFVINPTGGTWNFTNGIGLRIYFPLFAGTNFLAAANQWQSGLFYASADAAPDLLDTLNNTFRVTDIQLQTGFVPTSFDRQPFDIEKARCERYYNQSFGYGVTPTQNVGADTGELRWMEFLGGGSTNASWKDYATEMRDIPTIQTFNPAAANSQCRDLTNNLDCNSTTTAFSSAKRLFVRSVSNAGTTAGSQIGVHYSANARI